MAIILRSSKSVPLTFTEMDGNFSELNARATTLEGAHIKNVNGVTTSSAQDNAITLDTDNISEGTTNKYFTNANSRSAISVTDAGGDGSLAYNSSTGVITYTGPSAAEVRAHISATSASGVTYTAGTGVIALASIPNSSITNSTITVAGDSGSTAIDLGDTLTVTGGSGLQSSQSGDTLTIDVSANGINDTHIDFGTGSNQVSTADLPEQTNLYYTNARADARIAAANLTDLNDVSYSSPTTNFVLTWTGSGWEPAEAPGATGGEANRVVNVGGHNELFKNKSGVVLNFRTIDHGNNLSITQSTDTLTINTVAAPEFGNIKIGGNSIENIATNSNIALVPNGTGVVTVDSDLLPASDSSKDLGASGTEWANAYIDAVTATNLTGTIQTGAQPNIVSIGSQTANLNMNNNKILNVTDPTLAQDAATKAYVDAQLATQDTLQEITDEGATTTNTITANGFTTDGLTVTDNNIQTTRSNDNIVMLPNGTGVVEMRSAVAMSANAITGVADPSSAQDAATKAYVDSSVSSLQSDKIQEGDTSVETIDSGTGSVVITVDNSARLTVAAATSTFTNNIIIPDAGNIGSASDTDAIAIAAGGDVTVSQGLIVTGNLTVNGTTTSLNTSEMKVEDINITLADGAADSAAADGAGITIDGAAATITYSHSGTKFVFNKPIDAGANAISTTGAISGTGAAITALSGSNIATGTVAAARVATLNQDTTGTAAIATTITVADEGTDTTCFPTFVTAATGNLGAKTDSVFTYNSSNGTLSATTFSGVATSAQYADLAEIYKPDVDYSPGTIVTIGGTQEITVANHNTQYLAGVISTAPAYLMNSAAEGEAVALVGRVPVRVVGAVNKGQAVFAADGGVATADATGPIVGIALESSSNTAEKLIECLLKV